MNVKKLIGFQFLIFTTGAVTVSLELVASRIMTPFFGQSLYIWTAILSSTLLFLALGYFRGGSCSKRKNTSDLNSLFLRLPILCAVFLIAACLIYPPLFPTLNGHLIQGCFIASLVLLGGPLILLAQLNPVLVALHRDKNQTGDSNAGRIFFTSTLGSVVGVFITAFVMIPWFTNIETLLIFALILCLTVLILTLKAHELNNSSRRKIIMASLVLSLICSVFFSLQKPYLELTTTNKNPDFDFKILGQFNSIYGNIKVVQTHSNRLMMPDVLGLFLDGVPQNETANGVSLNLYTHVLENLALADPKPEQKNSLVLGLGAGVIPQRLTQQGHRVSVVEINPDMLEAATQFFDFNPASITFYFEDARTFARKCRPEFDSVIFDVFNGVGAPAHLMTKEFFSEIKHCLKPDGLLVMNTHPDEKNPEHNLRLLKTVALNFSKVWKFQIPQDSLYILATDNSRLKDVRFDPYNAPDFLKNQLISIESSGHIITLEWLKNVEPVSDQKNDFESLFAGEWMLLKKLGSKHLPSHLFIN